MVFVGLISLPKNLISFVLAWTRELANNCELDSADKDYSFAFRLFRVCCQANNDYEIFVKLFFQSKRQYQNLLRDNWMSVFS